MQYSNAPSFAEGLAPVCNMKGHWGYIDHNSNEAIPFKYSYASAFLDGYGKVLFNSKWYNVDKSGTLTKIDE
ncbi:MAG: hypothetical protein C4308_09235 [Chitinophagaceae bacterium]